MPQEPSNTSLPNLADSGTSFGKGSKHSLNKGKGSKKGKGAKMTDETPSKPESKAELTPGAKAQCDRCNKEVIPCDDTHPSLGTHLTAVCLFILGLPFCIFLPYCFDCFGKPVKRCSNCGNYLQGR